LREHGFTDPEINALEKGKAVITALVAAEAV
jgi:hypothetical protein